jgi:S1-C subfamily serine protease
MNILPKILVPGLLVLALSNIARADHEVYQRTLPSTVMVVRLDEDNKSTTTGSGALVNLEHRLVVTNFHVVGKSSEVVVVFPSYDADGKLIVERSAYANRVAELRGESRLVTARVVVREPRRDLALIELAGVPTDAQALRLAAESAKPGQRVHSIGHPAGSEALWVYTGGTVRQVYHRTFVVDGELRVEARVVETQSPINPGDSGGPVVNDRGELVAIVESTHAGDRVHLMSIFIDITEVRALLGNYANEQDRSASQPAASPFSS